MKFLLLDTSSYNIMPSPGTIGLTMLVLSYTLITTIQSGSDMHGISLVLEILAIRPAVHRVLTAEGLFSIIFIFHFFVFRNVKY